MHKSTHYPEGLPAHRSQVLFCLRVFYFHLSFGCLSLSLPCLLLLFGSWFSLSVLCFRQHYSRGRDRGGHVAQLLRDLPTVNKILGKLSMVVLSVIPSCNLRICGSIRNSRPSLYNQQESEASQRYTRLCLKKVVHVWGEVGWAESWAWQRSHTLLWASYGPRLSSVWQWLGACPSLGSFRALICLSADLFQTLRIQSRPAYLKPSWYFQESQK